MDNTLGSSSQSFSSINHKQGFTLIEVMVAIAIVAILSTIALPSLNEFIVKMRVDNEISEMQRLLLTARNTAINTGKNTTVCPLVGGNCTANWTGQISVFTNSANTLANGTSFAGTDELVKVKEAIKTGDNLQFSDTSVIYTPTGRLLTPVINRTFRYCPKGETDSSRGINVSISGRSYTSSDTNNDGKDEDRNGDEISC